MVESLNGPTGTVQCDLSAATRYEDTAVHIISQKEGKMATIHVLSVWAP